MRKFLIFLLVVAGLTGCTPTLNDARIALGSVNATYNDLEPKLEAKRRAQGRACLELRTPKDEACLTIVNQRWAPVEKAVHAVYVVLATATVTLRTAEATATLGQTIDTAAILRVILEAVTAIDTFRTLAVPPEAP